ncbi:MULTISPECIES: HK97 family phage prohead protease [Aurantimonas]|uniref:HK97 family phage prohead protease n=1 Tax=Aurantimonas TaxID=182269 RepID=UPI00351522F5
MPKLVKVSEDEAHNLRKDSVGPNGGLVKGVPMTPEIAKAGSWKPETRTARFVMSAEVEDRMGDIVVQEGLDVTNFSANPQALLFHNSRSWPIGKWANVQKMLSGRPKRTEGDMILLAEGEDPDADRAARHIAAGTMKTVSIGFRPNWSDVEAIQDDAGHFLGLKFNKSELLECSLVPIPALPAAMMKDVAPGMLSKEALELIEMTLDTFAMDPRTGLVISRDALEAQHRQASGERTSVVIEFKDQASVDRIAALLKSASTEGRVIEDEEKGAAKPAKPTEEEQGVETPDPVDGEKQKAADAEQAASVAEFERHLTIARDHARQSKEPGLWAKFLSALTAKDTPVVTREDPPLETPTDPEPVNLTDEEKAALDERVAKRIAATRARTEEPA